MLIIFGHYDLYGLHKGSPATDFASQSATKYKDKKKQKKSDDRNVICIKTIAVPGQCRSEPQSSLSCSTSSGNLIGALREIWDWTSVWDRGDLHLDFGAAPGLVWKKKWHNKDD